MYGNMEIYIITAITDSPDVDTTNVQIASFDLDTQNEELQEILEDEDVSADNLGSYVKL